MVEVKIEANDKEPYISLNPETGEFTFKGKSIPVDAEEFYAPILDWLDGYIKKPAQKTTVHIDLDFFNISSSKRLLFIMYRLNEMADKGHNVELKWYYYDDDDDMFEVGQDYAFMVKVPFEFISKERSYVEL